MSLCINLVGGLKRLNRNFLAKKETCDVLFKKKYSTRELLKEAYCRTKLKCRSKKLPQDVNPKGAFACNELDLSEVKVYGFDYDYTLAHYKPTLEHLLYNLGREVLLEKYNYPPEILNLEYKPNFAVRGLHYDIEKGLLLKLDSFLQIQFGAVYRGLTPISTEEVLKLYRNRIIPIAYVEGDMRAHKANRAKMVHLADLFSVPEMGLLCNVAEYFIKNHIDYHPEILFLDVKNSVQSCHPVMHKIVAQNVDEYIRPNPRLKKYFEKLQNCDKKLFLVTNSPFHFVNAGMEMLVGHSWREYFDVVIVNANKPKFFTEVSRPIRVFDKNANTHIWEKVTALEKGIIYYEGTVKQLQDLTGWSGHQVLYFGDHPYSDLADVTLEHGWRTGAIINELTDGVGTKSFTSETTRTATSLTSRSSTAGEPAPSSTNSRSVKLRPVLQNEIEASIDLTGWSGHQVLYFGDHPYSDLADVTLEHGWRTGAIINELTHEINTLNTQSFKENANWLQMLTQLIEDHQDYKEPEAVEVIGKWMAERDYLRLKTQEAHVAKEEISYHRNEIKAVFNPQFGSVFRTYHNPTYFSRRLFRFADIYTSNITNLLDYSLTHTFYPRRGVMPHEYGSYFV